MLCKFMSKEIVSSPKGRENFHAEKTVHLNRAFEDEQYLDIQKREVFHREEGAYCGQVPHGLL